MPLDQLISSAEHWTQAVITHTVTGQPEYVAVEDFGLSDHHLLRWVVSTTRDTPSPVSYTHLTLPTIYSV